MLNFDASWRFESPGEIPQPVVHKFREFIVRIATQGDQWDTLEHFKSYFARAAGRTPSRSSSESWADSDLADYMYQAADNAAMFIEAFYDGCSLLQKQNPGYGVPDVTVMNRTLREHEAGYEIRPPDLIFGVVAEQVIVNDRHPSLDDQAQDLIQKSLKQSERLLSEGRNRPAVSEILWLLETVSTAFRGTAIGSATVQEKYFNKIVWELRKHHKGQILDQVLEWVMTLHGFLSSPTGGGVRHGTDMKSATDMPAGDAQLYCNLIRSYIGFLMSEHARMSKT